MPSRPPNILLLMSDDHRHDAMGCAGNQTTMTPNLDALAQRGTRLTQAHIMGGHSPAVCVPSRACLNTGRNCFESSQSRCDYTSLQTIPAHVTTMGEAFGAAGWRTFHTGKWHLDPASLNRSFAEVRSAFLGGMDDHFRLPLHDHDPRGIYPRKAAQIGDRHSSEIFADTAIDWMQSSADDERPFFLSCCFTSPHDPRQAPAEWHARFPAEKMPLPPNFLECHPFDNGELTIRDECLEAVPRTAAAIRRHIADYYALIAHQDHHMGRIIACLDELGMAEETIIVYTGDHGLAVGSHGLMGKQNCYDHAIRIPMIFAGPSIPSQVEASGRCYGFDLFPTLCEWAGVPIPESVEGISAVPVVHGDTGRATIYSVYMDAQASIKDQRWKLICTYRRANGRGEDRLQLFDLIADPHECIDRIAESSLASIREELLAEMLRWQRSLGDRLAEQTAVRLSAARQG